MGSFSKNLSKNRMQQQHVLSNTPIHTISESRCAQQADSPSSQAEVSKPSLISRKLYNTLVEIENFTLMYSRTQRIFRQLAQLVWNSLDLDKPLYKQRGEPTILLNTTPHTTSGLSILVSFLVLSIASNKIHFSHIAHFSLSFSQASLLSQLEKFIRVT